MNSFHARFSTDALNYIQTCIWKKPLDSALFGNFIHTIALSQSQTCLTYFYILKVQCTVLLSLCVRFDTRRQGNMKSFNRALIKSEINLDVQFGDVIATLEPVTVQYAALRKCGVEIPNLTAHIHWQWTEWSRRNQLRFLWDFFSMESLNLVLHSKRKKK